MASEHKDLIAFEIELRRIFRSYGAKTVEIEGVHHIGICSVRQVGTQGGAFVPPGAEAAAIPLTTLARDILEALR